MYRDRFNQFRLPFSAINAFSTMFGGAPSPVREQAPRGRTKQRWQGNKRKKLHLRLREHGHGFREIKPTPHYRGKLALTAARQRDPQWTIDQMSNSARTKYSQIESHRQDKKLMFIQIIQRGLAYQGKPSRPPR